MIALIDSNVILDVLEDRRPFVEDSMKVQLLCETDVISGHVSALTIPNIAYIVRKRLGRQHVSGIVRALMEIYTVDELSPADLKRASEADWSDFEDAFQGFTALRIHADAVITRNVKDFVRSPVEAMTPTDFLHRYGYVPDGDDQESEARCHPQRIVPDRVRSSTGAIPPAGSSRSTCSARSW